MRFEASQAVFWSLSCYKELKLTTNWFTGRTLRDLLIQMQNITCSLQSSDMRRKQNFTFSPPLFFRFSCLICSFCWAFSRLHFGEKNFRKAFRILGLFERKGGWVVEQDFHEDFQGNVTCFVLPFSLVLLSEMCSFWYA